MKRLLTKKSLAACGIIVSLLLVMAVIFAPIKITHTVDIAPQEVPLEATMPVEEGTPTLDELQLALDGANVQLELAKTAQEQTSLVLQTAQNNFGVAETSLQDAQQALTTAQTAKQNADAALSADSTNEQLINESNGAEAALVTAQENADNAQAAFTLADEALKLAQDEDTKALQAITDAQNEVSAAQTAIDNFKQTLVPQINTYEIVLHTLNNKLLTYDNDKSTNVYIQAISTEFTTITLTDSDLIKDADGNVTGVTLSEQALLQAGTPGEATGYGSFIGFGPTKNATDGQVISAPYVFNVVDGVTNSDVLSFNLYAKFNAVPDSNNHSLLFEGVYYNYLAYSQADLAAANNLPADELYNSANDPAAANTDADGLYGEKTAQWEYPEDNIGSIQFDFTMTPTTQDTDIIIVLDKSTSMPSGYVGNGVTNWQSAVEAVNSLAEGLLRADNSANNRVALVQFSGNTINSFNFQNNLADFSSKFVDTKPSGAHIFRDASGNIIFDHDYNKTSESENPSADGTNYTVALEQAQVFAESRGTTDRELVVLFISDGVPEALLGFQNPSNLTRAWTRTFGSDTLHSVSGVATKDQQNAIVQSYNGQSVLNSGFTPVINTIGINASTATSLTALSTQTGGTHYNIGYSNSNNIDTLATIVNDIFEDTTNATRMTNAVISDVVTDDFKIIANAQYPVTLQRGNDVQELQPAQGSTPGVGEYIIETIDYNGEPREQITANIDYIGEEILTFKFYVEASDAGLLIGNYPTNEEHTLTYEHEGEDKTRNDLGEPELPVVDEIPANPTAPTAPTTPTTPTEPTAPQTNEQPEPTPTPTTPADSETDPIIAPAPIADDEEFGGVSVPEILVPLASGLQNTSVQIGDMELPLASFGRSWALLNLILTLVTAFISIVLVINYFGRKNNEQSQYEAEKTEENIVKRKGFSRLLSIGVAVIAIVLFILTEDMTTPMAIVDEWTFLMALVALAQIVTAFVSRKKYVENENAQ